MDPFMVNVFFKDIQFLRFFSWGFPLNIEVEGLILPLIIISLFVILYICSIRVSDLIHRENTVYPLDEEYSNLFRKLKIQSEYNYRCRNPYWRHTIYDYKHWNKQGSDCTLNPTNLIQLNNILKRIPEKVLASHRYFIGPPYILKMSDDVRRKAACSNDKLIGLLAAYAVCDLYPHLKKR